MFKSSTFSSLHDKNDEIWKFQRLKLVLEYVDISMIPPPPYIIGIFFYLIKGHNKYQKNSSQFIEDKKYADIYLSKEKYSMLAETDSRLTMMSDK